MISDKKIFHLGNYVLYLDFIDPPQNHCLFHQSSAKIVHILEITYKEIIYIGYMSWGKNDKFCQLGECINQR